MSNMGSAKACGYARCNGKAVRADRLEAVVWQDSAEFIRNPGYRLAEAQRQLRARLTRAVDTSDRRTHIQQALAGKETERERVMTLFRRGHASLKDTERQLESIQREAEAVSLELAALRADHDVTQALEEQVTGASALLLRLRDQVDDIERSIDIARKQQILQDLVAGVTIRTEGEELRTRQPVVEIRYTFGQPSAVEMGTGAAISRT